MNDSAPFDLEAVYDTEIAPLMMQIIEICQRVGMPMVATFCYRKGQDPDDPEALDYCTTCIAREAWLPPEIVVAARIIRGGNPVD